MVYVTARHMAGGSGHQHIASVRWTDPATGNSDESTREQMITWIEQNGDARVRGNPDARIGVVNANPKYIQTYADKVWTNNLLSLPTY